ncbi:signal transduction histidine kinase, nitrogen specific, NtrB [Desulfotomaculum nigrificans CO-1-SRB]|uniref:histidine kinase n=1 Tax=Desulfotomaculum nigrificans (strain DSM 14880 / VKM B-2319 / CO-1-SRB) TaxID=868595 RepID=F6B929_DESCC|nr:two-component system sensor histidine kinase AtoS [Desulfotomaculum nigrificans]AEF93680.1 signal transduction histidine kinase, nitrogen specific, NtrB [Desulfotomaculum nigrificans CO-1-SRB]
MLKKFKNQLMILIGILLVLPILIIGAMLYMINHTRPMVLDEQRANLTSAVVELSQAVPADISYLMRKQHIAKANRPEQIKALNRELAGAVMKVFQKNPGIELGYYSPEVKAILVQMGQDSHLPYMDFKDMFLDVAEETHWSEQAQWKDAFDKVTRSKQPLELILGAPGHQKLVIFHPLIYSQNVAAVIWAGERLGGINKEILQAESFAYTVIFFGFMIGLCSTFFLLKNYLDTVASIKNGLQKLQNDLTYVIPPSMGELGEVSKAINDLAARLVRAQNYNEIIMANIDAGIIAVDLTGRIVSVSNTARRIFQLPEDVIDRRLSEVFPPDSDIVQMLTKCLSGQETKDALIKSPDQERHLLASTSIMVDVDQKLVGAVLGCRDITLRMRLEEQVRRQERLASLGKLVAGVAHEIKNPLTSISGYIQYWQRSKAPTAKSLNTIYREVRRLDSIVNKLLFFAKPTNQVLTRVSLNQFVEEVLNFFTETQADGIKFTLKLQENLPDVYIDPGQIEQVLINIIFNAIQAMPGGGEIMVSTGHQAAENLFYIEVRDTGCGVPEQLLDKLFDPFFTTKAKGTGLGLTIAHEIMHAHGGRIEVKSREGAGTTVQILFPGGRKNEPETGVGC